MSGIDPPTNRVVATIRVGRRPTNELATACRGRLIVLAGSEIPPVIAAGTDAVWVRANEPHYPYGLVAVGIDPRTSEAVSKPLSLGGSSRSV